MQPSKKEQFNCLATSILFRELEIYTRFVFELQYRRTTLVSHNTLHENVLLGLAQLLNIFPHYFVKYYFDQ